MMDYVTIGVGRLTNQFQDSPRFIALVTAMLQPFSELEDVADALKSQRWIDIAVGAQLDGAGYIVGEYRQGRDDDAYREAIMFRIFVNTSNATPEDMIKGLRFLTKPDDIQYMEQYPATAILFTGGPVIPSGLQRTMQGLAPAAISDVQILVSYGRNYPFRFSRSAPLGELFVNNDQDYLTAQGSDLQVQTQEVTQGARFGGIAASDLFVNDVSYIELSNGSILALNVSNLDAVIESGFHLTGVF